MNIFWETKKKGSTAYFVSIVKKTLFSGDLMGKLHHLDVGTGDASIIISDTATFLIDCHKVEEYAHLLPTSKRIRGVFITHQHADHFSGLEYLKENDYSLDVLVYSPYERRYGDNSIDADDWAKFNSYKEYFRRKGTKLYAQYRQDNFDEPWWETNGIKFWMLSPASSIANAHARELHDACLVIYVEMNDRCCLFTGDASDKNLEYISYYTTNICDDILHASHHGSLNGASLSFIRKCNMKYTVISTKAGVYENVPHPTALRRYIENTAEKVYRTDTSDTLTWSF